jgi:hypothetical protein
MGGKPEVMAWSKFIGITSGFPVILEELKKSLLPGVFSTNRLLIDH